MICHSRPRRPVCRRAHIVIGFRTGRCGTSNMAANLDSSNGCAAITHERGNMWSLDYCEGFTDKFCIAGWSMERVRKHAATMLNAILDTARPSTHVVGDTSHANTMFMDAFLRADPRVVAVFQFRPVSQWLLSHLASHAHGSVWESFIFQQYGSPAHKCRKEKLKLFHKAVHEFACKLRSKWGRHRVVFVPLAKLKEKGVQLKRRMGLTPCRWQVTLGANRRDKSRSFRQKMQ